MALINLTDDNFEKEVLKSEIPVLVDFWADWCMPCKMIAPVIESIAADFKGKVKVAKMNTDENRTPTEFGIMSIPTLLIFKDGSVIDQIVGAVPRQLIVDKLNYYAQGVGALN